MPFKYRVVAREKKGGSTTTLMNFFARQLVSAEAAKSLGNLEYDYGQWMNPAVLAQEIDRIRQTKGIAIWVDAGTPYAIHAFLEAQKGHGVIDLEITVIQDAAVVETIALPNVRVTDLVPISKGAYVVILKLTGSEVQDFDEKGLYYYVTLYQKPKRGEKWNDDSNWLAEFITKQIFVPPVPPEDVKNRLQVQRLFDAIAARRQVSMTVRGAEPRNERVTHQFIEAQRVHAAYNIDIFVYRDLVTEGLRQEVDKSGYVPVPKVVRESKHNLSKVADTSLQVVVQDYLPTKDGNYVARLKVTEVLAAGWEP